MHQLLHDSHGVGAAARNDGVLTCYLKNTRAQLSADSDTVEDFSKFVGSAGILNVEDADDFILIFLTLLFAFRGNEDGIAADWLPEGVRD